MLSECCPNTHIAWEKWRSETDNVYDTVHEVVGAHHVSGSAAFSRRSSAICARLHIEPDTAKKKNRGGRRPPMTHESAHGCMRRTQENDARFFSFAVVLISGTVWLGYGYGYGYILGPSPVPPIYLSGSFGLVRPAWIRYTGYILGPSPVPPIYLSGSFGLVRPAWI